MIIFLLRWLGDGSGLPSSIWGENKKIKKTKKLIINHIIAMEQSSVLCVIKPKPYQSRQAIEEGKHIKEPTITQSKNKQNAWSMKQCGWASCDWF